MAHHHETRHARVAARRLRRRSSRTEDLVWSLVRGRRLLGYKFRRQHPIGRFVVDFYCHELRLVLELEGDVHASPAQLQADVQRAAFLTGLGLRVARLENVDATLDNLLRLVNELESPLPSGRR